MDLREFRDAGGGWVIDTMPTGAGRRARKLAAASQQSGVHIVCPTGLHLPLYYPPDHPMLSMDQEELAEVFREGDCTRPFVTMACSCPTELA